MKKFGKKSADKLRSCHKDLILLCESVLQEMDITILCGFRGEVEQNEAYNTGKSKLNFPQSKHNKSPSLAVDVAPYPIDWSDVEKFKKMCLLFEEHAEKLGIDIRLGRDFSFRDYVHFELKEA